MSERVTIAVELLELAEASLLDGLTVDAAILLGAAIRILRGDESGG